jgi:hypothetical protein
MMSHQEEVAALKAQVGILAEHVGRMIHIVSAQNECGRDTQAVEARLAVMEDLMWKLHTRHVRLKAGLAPPLLH